VNLIKEGVERFLGIQWYVIPTVGGVKPFLGGGNARS